MYKSETTAANFKQRVSGVIRAGKSIRENIKVLMQFAIMEYLRSGNTECIRYLATEVSGLKSMSTKKLVEWTEDTVNVKFGKSSDGDIVVRKAVKGEDPALTADGDIDSEWWEHGRPPEAKAVDMLAGGEALVKRIMATQDVGTKKPLKAGQECAAQQFINAIEGAIAQAKAAIERAELEANADVEVLDRAA